MFRSITLCALLLATSFATCHAGTSKDQLIEKLIVATGMDAVIEGFPDQMVARIEQQPARVRDAESDQFMNRVFVESFDVEVARHIMIASVDRGASVASLEKMLAWFETPLAQRLIAAENSIARAETDGSLWQFAQSLQANPPTGQRIALIQDLEESAHMTESAMILMEMSTRGMLEAMNSILPPEDGFALGDIETQIDTMRPALRDATWQKMLLISHFAYRHFSNEDIRAYISFLDSELGQQYVELGVVAYMDVFSDYVGKVAAKLRIATLKAHSPTGPVF